MGKRGKTDGGTVPHSPCRGMTASPRKRGFMLDLKDLLLLSVIMDGNGDGKGTNIGDALLKSLVPQTQTQTQTRTQPQTQTQTQPQTQPQTQTGNLSVADVIAITQMMANRNTYREPQTTDEITASIINPPNSGWNAQTELPPYGQEPNGGKMTNGEQFNLYSNFHNFN